jgi:hypothetical protein
MGGSQLSQLKAALHGAGLSRNNSNSSSSKKKRASRGKDRIGGGDAEARNKKLEVR